MPVLGGGAKTGVEQLLVLGEEAALFSGVAGGGSCLDTVIFIHIGSDAFVEGGILCWKIVVILVVRVEIF